jgi:hypothetical protein
LDKLKLTRYDGTIFDGISMQTSNISISRDVLVDVWDGQGSAWWNAPVLEQVAKEVKERDYVDTVLRHDVVGDSGIARRECTASISICVDRVTFGTKGEGKECGA